MILALDASTYEGTVALLDDRGVVAEGTSAMRGRDEDALMPLVESLVRAHAGGWRGIDEVLVGGGPGSFTSLRIAASIAKGVAYARRVPLRAVSSLALVVTANAHRSAGRYLAVSDAMRGEWFLQQVIWRGGANDEVTVEHEAVFRRLTTEAVVTEVRRQGATLVGTASLKAPPFTHEVAPPHVRGAFLLLRSGAAPVVSLDDWEPNYGRLAEAQVKWEVHHGQGLPVGEWRPGE